MKRYNVYYSIDLGYETEYSAMITCKTYNPKTARRMAEQKIFNTLFHHLGFEINPDNIKINSVEDAFLSDFNNAVEEFMNGTGDI